MANYTSANCNCCQTLILKLLFKVLVGAHVRSYCVLAMRQQLSAWLLPSSMKALSFHRGRSAKRRKLPAKETLMKGLPSAQKQAPGLPAPRRAARRKVHCGAYWEEQRERHTVPLETPELCNMMADNQPPPPPPRAWETARRLSVSHRVPYSFLSLYIAALHFPAHKWCNHRLGVER